MIDEFAGVVERFEDRVIDVAQVGEIVDPRREPGGCGRVLADMGA